MALFYKYLFLVFIISLGFGAFAQIGRFCLLGGLREWLQKNNMLRLWVFLGALAVALCGVSLLEYFSLINLDTSSPPYRTENFQYGRYIIGGLVFGLGMVLASGCGMRNLILAGQGSLKSAVIIIAMAISIYVMLKMNLFATLFMPLLTPLSISLTDISGSSINHQDLASILFGSGQYQHTMRLTIALLIALPLLFFALKNTSFRQARYLLGSIGVGLMITLGFYITGGPIGQTLLEESEFMDQIPRGLATQSFSFAAPMADSIYALLYTEGITVITFGVVAIIGLPLGALLASLLRQEFKLKGLPQINTMLINLFGAILMGVGSVVAMGCSIGHGLTGVSTLALGSILALLFICIGALIGIRIYPQGQ